MAELVGAVECAFSTDYALLYAVQRAVFEPPTTLAYASSAPGAVAMACGTKYANVEIRLERWDAKPPDPGDDWEDLDELPWETVDGAGPVVPQGFDPAGEDVEGLPLDGLGRARVQVLARGRHQYGGDEYVEDAPPEQWLLRWWPDGRGLDALAGPPRRIAGRLPFSYARAGWWAALHAWAQTGWDAAMRGVTAFDEIAGSLRRLDRPPAPGELAELWGPWGPQRNEHGRYDWSSPVLGHVPPAADESYVEDKRRRLEPLARAAGGTLETFGDALAAMMRLGLLARGEGPDGEVLVPNPQPRPAWEVLDVGPEREVQLRREALMADYAPVEPDVAHLVRWAPGRTLRATPRGLAVRLAIPADDVVGCLRLMQVDRTVRVEADEDPITPDTVVTLTGG